MLINRRRVYLFHTKSILQIQLRPTFVLNFCRKSRISVSGSTALSSVVPITANTVITGMFCFNFSFRVRSSSENKDRTRRNRIKFD